MKLVLVRHGEAVSEQVDPERPLSEKGRREVAEVAATLKKKAVEVSQIWHSKKLRAIQTAEEISKGIGFRGSCEKIEGLNPNDPTDQMEKKVKELSLDPGENSLMIVGHLPFLETLADSLLKDFAQSQEIQLGPAGTVCLENSGGKWRIQWQTGPRSIL